MSSITMRVFFSSNSFYVMNLTIFIRHCCNSTQSPSLFRVLLHLKFQWQLCSNLKWILSFLKNSKNLQKSLSSIKLSNVTTFQWESFFFFFLNLDNVINKSPFHNVQFNVLIILGESFPSQTQSKISMS